MEKRFSEKTLIPQLDKISLTFYGSRTIIAVFTKFRPFFSVLSQINSVYALPVYFFKIYFNIIFPSTPT